MPVRFQRTAFGTLAATTVLLGVSAFVSVPASAQTIITDGNFTNWSLGNIGTTTTTRESSGGNPGARLNITTLSGLTTLGTAIKEDYTTNQSLSGVAFTLSLDVLSGSGANSQGQGIYLLVEQNDTLYGKLLGITGFPLNFDTVSFSGTLNATEFNVLSGVGLPLPSFDGGVVTMFGFAAGNTNSGTLTQYYDNFRLEIAQGGNTAPEPGTFALCALPLLGLVLRRRTFCA